MEIGTEIGKENVLMLTKGVYVTLQKYLSENQFVDDDYLFKSRKGENSPLSVSSANWMMKEWTFGMKGNFVTHSLRKTFGYMQRTKFGVSFEVLCRRFNHSNPSTAMSKTWSNRVDCHTFANLKGETLFELTNSFSPVE